MAQNHRFDLKPFIVPSGSKVLLANYDPAYTGQLKGAKHGMETLEEDISDLADAQELLWSSKQQSLLIIFQAMDAAGKDGTIKHVMSGINPQGCDVFSFKAPTEEERLHHFLWRPERFLPQRGKITIFNRSYYEEVLVVRVHPEFLTSEWVSEDLKGAPLWKVWESRYADINEFEKRISKNGITVIKFFLHLSKEEQRNRFLRRLSRPEKMWKFSMSDFKERAYWDEYQKAFEDMLSATSTEWAPWYVVPADNKWFMRSVVADVITSRIEKMNLKYPDVPREKLAELEALRTKLEKEGVK